MIARAPLLLLWMLFAACASLRFEGAAALKIECNVPEAAVYIDDQFVGRAAEWATDGRFIKPGFHRIELRHPDHHPDFNEVTFARGDAVLLRPVMRPLLD